MGANNNIFPGLEDIDALVIAAPGTKGAIVPGVGLVAYAATTTTPTNPGTTPTTPTTPVDTLPSNFRIILGMRILPDVTDTIGGTTVAARRLDVDGIMHYWFRGVRHNGTTFVIDTTTRAGVFTDNADLSTADIEFRNFKG